MLVGCVVMTVVAFNSDKFKANYNERENSRCAKLCARKRGSFSNLSVFVKGRIIMSAPRLPRKITASSTTQHRENVFFKNIFFFATNKTVFILEQVH